MSNDVDPTNAMPEAGTTSDAAVGDALFAQMDGSVGTPATSEREVWQPEAQPTTTSDLESLIDQDEAPVGDAEPAPEPAADVPTIDELELKVKGVKDPVKVPKNWDDPQVQELLNKGARFDVKMQEIAKQTQDLEARLKQTDDYAEKSEIADRVNSAKEFLKDGHKKHALAAIFGDSTESFIASLVEDEVAYQSASPEERLNIDLARQKQNEQLRAKNDSDRIAKLEARINARSEQVQEAEFTGYIEDAKTRYDLGQWVEDADAASDLNDMLHTAAMSDIVRLQRSRESKGLSNVDQRDIRRAYASRAKRLIASQDSQSSKLADEKVAKQSEAAAANAQVASTKNYGQPSVNDMLKKAGGSMSDLVDMFRGRGGKI